MTFLPLLWRKHSLELCPTVSWPQARAGVVLAPLLMPRLMENPQTGRRQRLWVGKRLVLAHVLLLASLDGIWLREGGQQTKQACRPSRQARRNKSRLAVAHTGPSAHVLPLPGAVEMRLGWRRLKLGEACPQRPQPPTARMGQSWSQGHVSFPQRWAGTWKSQM